MTLLELPETGDRVEGPDTRVSAWRRRLPHLSRRERRRLAIVAVAVAIGVALLIVFLEGPVGGLMYSQRQRERTAQYRDAAGAADVGRGDALAIVQAPIIDLNVAVVEGDGPADLRGGPGHRPGTPLPGQVGNSVISGRRQSFGGPFDRLAELTPGALISVQVRGSLSAVDYLVREVVRVREYDASALAPQPGERVLTLVTSDGGLFSQDRLIVVADYDAGLPLLPRAANDREPPLQAVLSTLEVAPVGDDSETLGDASGFDSGVTLLGTVVALVWIGVLVMLIGAVSALRARFAVWLTALVTAPLIGAAVLQLWFSLDELGPITR